MSMRRYAWGLSVITIALTIAIFHSADYDFRQTTVEEFTGGDFFVSIADIVIQFKAPKVQKCIQLPVEKSITKDDVIVYFVKTDCLGFFRSHLKTNKNKFIMITHNSAYSVPTKHRAILDNSLLVHWYGQNIALRHPKLSGIPVGIANSYFSHGNKTILAESIQRFTPQSKTLSYEEYLEDVGNTRFVVSPPGHGIDCYRTWEALALGAIPIVVNTSISELYDGERVLIVKDFRNVTHEILEAFAARYPVSIKSLKVYGDYWRQRIELDRQLAKLQ